jgi:ferredoxin--NADP+ reductase
MPEEKSIAATVAVLGAGPAGLFAARELAQAGCQVALINRDIKPGGLAEYGIYPSKHKMKEGLRRQFRQVMEEDSVHYFGHLAIGEEQEIKLDDLRGLGFDGVLVTVGAQGTKWLGLPGEDLEGVYHAKDLVYHYNKLPPFSEEKFAIGKRILCVGVGNVMLDIAHWTVRELKVDEVIAIARRGPADVKFTKKEMAIVGANLDLKALDEEIERTRPVLEAVGQNPEEAKAFILSAVEKSEESVSDTRFRLEFLASPKAMVGDDKGRVRGVEVENTTLELRDDNLTHAKGLGTTRIIECDTVVFCIGDRVDASLGLPLNKWGEFAKNPKPSFPIEEISYEAYDPESKKDLNGVFLGGWAREASHGLVGTARKDGTNGAHALMEYLEKNGSQGQYAIAALEARLQSMDRAIVRKADWEKLEKAEQAQAQKQGLEEFKFASDEKMLEVMGLSGEKQAA